MKPVQVVLDAELLEQLDQHARRRHLSRSAFLRQVVAESLQRLRMAELVEADRDAWAKHPETAGERATARMLTRSQASVMGKLSRAERW